MSQSHVILKYVLYLFDVALLVLLSHVVISRSVHQSTDRLNSPRLQDARDSFEPPAHMHDRAEHTTSRNRGVLPLYISCYSYEAEERQTAKICSRDNRYQSSAIIALKRCPTRAFRANTDRCHGRQHGWRTRLASFLHPPWLRVNRLRSI